MITCETGAFKNNPKYKMDKLPIFLTNDYVVIEAPTKWVLSLAKRRITTTKHGLTSPETIREYAWIMERFLLWLDTVKDDTGRVAGAENWDDVDQEMINQYTNYLIVTSGKTKRLKQQTIKYYIARLQDFYDWARQEGYEHSWNFNVKDKTFHLPNVGMWGSTVTNPETSINLGPEAMTAISSKRDNIVTREQLEEALPLFDDVVYMVIATIIAQTGLRPKDFLQLPYRGKYGSTNAGLHPYETKGTKIPEYIYYEFDSKGKSRSIKFPGDCWEMICTVWMPLRRKERAEAYAKIHNGKSPSNDHLFISKSGHVVTYDMVQDCFSAIGKSQYYSGHRFTARMLRHHFASYFVLSRLEHYDLVGNSAYQVHIDEELRQFMGHTDIGTTYKYYIDLIQIMNFEDSVFAVLDPYFSKMHSLVAELAVGLNSADADRNAI